MFEFVRRCDFCGADPSHFTRGFSICDNWNICKCQKCELVFLNPRPDIEHITDFYSKNFRVYDPNRRKEKLKNSIMKYAGGYKESRVFLSFFSKVLSYGISSIIHNKNGEKLILDIGCGNGSHMYFANKNDWDVVGLDSNMSALRAVKEIKGLTAQKMFECVAGDSERIPFKKEIFDTILMNHLLEHSFHPSNVLKEASRVLKKKGILIVSVPNYGSLESKLFHKYWFGLDCPRHLYDFTPETLRGYLEKSDFKIYREHYKKICIPDDFVNFSIKRYLNYTSDNKLRVMSNTIIFCLYKYVRYFLFLFPIKKSLKYPVITYYAQKL